MVILLKLVTSCAVLPEIELLKVHPFFLSVKTFVFTISGIQHLIRNDKYFV
jgi:hypothetical protein